MPRTALFFFCLLGASVAFNPVTDDLTVPIFTNMMNLTLKFKEFIPASIVTEIEDILKPENAPEVEHLVKLNNEFRRGELNFTMPNTREEALQLMKQYAPKTHERCIRILNNFFTKYNSLSPEAKKFVDTTENRYYELHKGVATASQMPQHMAKSIQFVLETDKAYHALPESVQTEFEKNWPENVKFIKSPMYTHVMNMVKNTNPEKLAELFEKMMTLAMKMKKN